MGCYISVEKALEIINEQTKSLYVCCSIKVENKFIARLHRTLRNNADKDVVPVIRCRNCKWCINKDYGYNSGYCNCSSRKVIARYADAFEAVNLDGFCSYGEL